MNPIARIVSRCAWVVILAAWALPPKPTTAIAVGNPNVSLPPIVHAEAPTAAALLGEPMYFPNGIKVTFQPEDYWAYAALRFPELAPVEFDGPFTGPVALTYIAGGEIWTICGIDKSNYPPDTTLAGCAQPQRGQCTIYIAPLDLLKKHGLTYRIVLRHEISHCRGWPGSHPGAR